MLGIKDYLEHNQGIICEMNDSPANNFWLTKFNFLEYFVESCTNTYSIDNKEVNALIINCKTIIEYMSPLKVYIYKSICIRLLKS